MNVFLGEKTIAIWMRNWVNCHLNQIESRLKIHNCSHLSTVEPRINKFSIIISINSKNKHFFYRKHFVFLGFIKKIYDVFEKTSAKCFKSGRWRLGEKGKRRWNQSLVIARPLDILMLKALKKPNDWITQVFIYRLLIITAI